MLIEDHINLQGTNPLVGANDDRVGPRFVDLTEVYARRLRAALDGRGGGERHRAAAAASTSPSLGPSFETPAEIRAYRTLGADLVGMSTVPEAISARHAGLEVAALSVVTNLAAGMAGEPLTHAETLSAVGRRGGPRRRPAGGGLAGDRPWPRLTCAALLEQPRSGAGDAATSPRARCR